jgi:hypothetical protein
VTEKSEAIATCKEMPVTTVNKEVNKTITTGETGVRGRGEAQDVAGPLPPQKKTQKQGGGKAYGVAGQKN